VARRWLELALQTLQISPLFSAALGRGGLGARPLDKAAMMQDVLALRGSTLSNRIPGFAAWNRRSQWCLELPPLPGLPGCAEQV